ncbi:MAG: hypothetical protein ACKPKO_56190, partial [Candidatus Fonsibacter sp.]
MSGRTTLSIRAGNLLLMVHEMADLPRILAALCEAGLALGKGKETVTTPQSGPAASHLLAGAAGAVQLMGQLTVASGIQKLRAEERPLPEHLARSVRALGSAAVFLWHPGALDQVLNRLRDHLAEGREMLQEDTSSEGGESTSSDAASTQRAAPRKCYPHRCGTSGKARSGTTTLQGTVRS